MRLSVGKQRNLQGISQRIFLALKNNRRNEDTTHKPNLSEVLPGKWVFADDSESIYVCNTSTYPNTLELTSDGTATGIFPEDSDLVPDWVGHIDGSTFTGKWEIVHNDINDVDYLKVTWENIIITASSIDEAYANSFQILSLYVREDEENILDDNYGMVLYKKVAE